MNFEEYDKYVKFFDRICNQFIKKLFGLKMFESEL